MSLAGVKMGCSQRREVELNGWSQPWPRPQGRHKNRAPRPRIPSSRSVAAGRRGRQRQDVENSSQLLSSCPAGHTHLVELEKALEETTRVLQQPLAWLPIIIHLGARPLPRHLLGLDALHDAHGFNDQLHAQWRSLHGSHLQARCGWATGVVGEERETYY